MLVEIVSVHRFGERLTFALKALSMSRGRLASELGVDKSLVGRWASGAVRPSAGNLERLTLLLAQRGPELSMLDWEKDAPEFASLFGLDATSFLPPDQTSLNLSPRLLEASRAATDFRGAAYEGFWRATHAALFERGRFCHQHGIIRREAGGLLQLEIGSPDVRYVGPLLPIDGQVCAIVVDTVQHLPSFMIFNTVSLPKIVLLDGLLLATGNALRTPAAYSMILERIGDLSGDREADDAHLESLMTRPEFIEDIETLPKPVREHLLRDFGPVAAADGGELMLTATATPRLAQIVAMANNLT
jgi:transcriptional regulator with XRE-family HTH domain